MLNENAVEIFRSFPYTPEKALSPALYEFLTVAPYLAVETRFP